MTHLSMVFPLKGSRIACASVLFLLSVSSLASAQAVVDPEEWRHGTTLNVFAGAASASSETGPLVGGAVGWEVMPWFAVEGSASWLNRDNGAGAFAADLKALIGLAPGRAVMPFVGGGIGLYRASFDHSRGAIPDFYSRRAAMNAAGVATITTFTDPSFIVGAGVNVFLTDHIAIRPDVEAKIVRRDSQNYVVGSIVVRLAYHFERHPVR